MSKYILLNNKISNTKLKQKQKYIITCQFCNVNITYYIFIVVENCNYYKTKLENERKEFFKLLIKILNSFRFRKRNNHDFTTFK